MIILGIESSCDETAVSVVRDGTQILSNTIATQIRDHSKFGGVVPEIASRKHCENILPLLTEALERAGIALNDADAIAVTYAPGLIGALLIGVSFAKGLALSLGKPLIPVHHIAGHIAANYIAHPELSPPFLSLVISGGHTQIVEVLSYTEFKIHGRTRDDAAGECFDKAARALGFPYPGGIYIDKYSQNGDAGEYRLPKPKISGSELDFSFSGLKTAVINIIHNANQKSLEINKENLCASLQKTVSEILAEKTLLAAKQLGYDKIVLAGGVSANSGIRRVFSGIFSNLYVPPPELCGDNAAMIAAQGYFNFKAGIFADESLNAAATMEL